MAIYERNTTDQLHHLRPFWVLWESYTGSEVAGVRLSWHFTAMDNSTRIGALDIAEAIHERIGTYVDMNSIQFLAVEQDRIHCWYMNSSGNGPTFSIELTRKGTIWALSLTEYPAGTEQTVEVP